MIHDISILVQPGTPEWPGDVPFACGWSARMELGANVNLSHIAGSPHVGTHADAPLHVHDGWPASDALPLAPFLGPVLVLDVEHALGHAVEDGRRTERQLQVALYAQADHRRIGAAVDQEAIGPAAIHPHFDAHPRFDFARVDVVSANREIIVDHRGWKRRHRRG